MFNPNMGVIHKMRVDVGVFLVLTSSLTLSSFLVVLGCGSRVHFWGIGGRGDSEGEGSWDWDC